MPDYEIKRGDLGYVIDRTLYRRVEADQLDLGTGQIFPLVTFELIDLTTATQVKLLLKDAAAGGTATAGGVCTKLDAANGVVRYVTVSADTNAVRLWNGEHEVTWATGAVETVPSSGFFTVNVVADLG